MASLRDHATLGALVSVWACARCGRRYVGQKALDGIVLFGIVADPADAAPEEMFRALDDDCVCGGDVQVLWYFATFIGGTDDARPKLVGFGDWPTESKLRLN